MIKEKGGIRTQYGHVIDILPTTLELLASRRLKQIRSIQQQPIQGISLAYALNDANAPSHHTVQYYYIFGSRAIYKDGWKAALAYPNDFLVTGTPRARRFDENAWELYNLNEDYTERMDLAKKYPEKLAQLKSSIRTAGPVAPSLSATSPSMTCVSNALNTPTCRISLRSNRQGTTTAIAVVTANSTAGSLMAVYH